MGAVVLVAANRADGELVWRSHYSKVLLYRAILAASVYFCDLYKRRRCATVSSTVYRVEIARCARFQSIRT